MDYNFYNYFIDEPQVLRRKKRHEYQEPAVPLEGEQQLRRRNGKDCTLEVSVCGGGRDQKSGESEQLEPSQPDQSACQPGATAEHDQGGGNTPAQDESLATGGRQDRQADPEDID